MWSRVEIETGRGDEGHASGGRSTYIILAPALAFWAMCLLAKVTTRPLGWALVFMALSMGLLPNVLQPLFGNNFALLAFGDDAAVCRPAGAIPLVPGQ